MNFVERRKMNCSFEYSHIENKGDCSEYILLPISPFEHASISIFLK